MRISPATARSPLIALGVVVAVGCWTSVALAGLLGSTNDALNDGGPDGGYWRGSHAISASLFGDELDATFEWAVFAPGTFQSFASDNGLNLNGFAPGASDVVYAYQVSQVNDPTSPGIDTITVGMDASDPISINPTQVLTGLGSEQQAQNSSLQGNTSAQWSYVAQPFVASDLLEIDETSSILVFGSPNAPQLDTFSVNSGIAGYTSSPTPMVGSPGDERFVPEPASAVLVLIGLIGWALAFRPGSRRIDN